MFFYIIKNNIFTYLFRNKSAPLIILTKKMLTIIFCKSFATPLKALSNHRKAFLPTMRVICFLYLVHLD